MRFTLSILIILSSIVVKAQEVVPDNRVFRFNLQQCLEYAYKNNDSLKNAQLDIQSAKYRVKETIGIGLPQVNGTASFQDFLKVPTTLLNGEFFVALPLPSPQIKQVKQPAIQTYRAKVF